MALSLPLFDRAAQALLEHVDRVHGGLQGAPRFPQFPLFGFLWRAWRRTRSPHLKQAVQMMLVHICQGGIHDHLGGGVALYAAYEVCLVPYFEKMLYNNALFIDLLTTVWQNTHHSLLARRVVETIGWIMQEMIVSPGAFAASLDANSAGEEGGQVLCLVCGGNRCHSGQRRAAVSARLWRYLHRLVRRDRTFSIVPPPRSLITPGRGGDLAGLPDASVLSSGTLGHVRPMMAKSLPTGTA